LGEAEDDLKSALKLQPDNSNYLDSLGLVYYKKAEYEKARRTFEKSVGNLKSMSKENAAVFGHLGDAYLRLGEREKAVAQWQKALELDPGDKSYSQKINQNR
jgi:tetratricopeptide (TPR) repeat protein